MCFRFGFVPTPNVACYYIGRIRYFWVKYTDFFSSFWVNPFADLHNCIIAYFLIISKKSPRRKHPRRRRLDFLLTFAYNSYVNKWKTKNENKS